MLQTIVNDSLLAFPILGWALLAIAILVLQIFMKSSWAALVGTLGGLSLLLIYSIATFDSQIAKEVFNGAAVFDSLTQVFNLIAIGIAIGVILTLLPGLHEERSFIRTSYEQLPEFLVCLLLSGFGLSVLASAIDLTSLFLGLETLSIGVYCLCGFFRTELKSTESAFKYLMIGAFSTAIFLYGVAFIYGAVGDTHYNKIYFVVQGGVTPFISLGALFLISGIAFKLAFVPFHLYTPDVYEGAPSPVTGYLATTVKVGVFAAALRIFWGFLEPVAAFWQPFWLSLCVLSIIVGNIVALQQKTLKKLLAFSSISHSGFMGLALLTAKPQVGSTFPLLSYLIVYSSMTLGVFALVSYLEDREKTFHIEDLKGLGQRRFGISMLLTIFILGLAGIPPLAGFMIKFWVLEALIQQNYLWVAIAAIVGSMIGAAYYLRILMYIFMADGKGADLSLSFAKDRYYALRIVVFLAAAVTILGGVRPQFYADWIFRALALK